MATGDAKETKDIPPGTKVVCTTCFDEKIEGEVVAFDYGAKVVIISILFRLEELFLVRKMSQVVWSRGESISPQERDFLATVCSFFVLINEGSPEIVCVAFKCLLVSANVLFVG